MRTAEVLYDLCEAFDICRERGRPLVVECTDETGCFREFVQFKVYPSGRLLVALDRQSPFQLWNGAK